MEADAADHDRQLLEVLERARTVGFLGPGPLRVHVDHAVAFDEALPPAAQRIVDLGSGGGVPALPVLIARPALQGVLIEAMAKRAVFLEWAVDQLGLRGRVSVRRQRAEEAARTPDLRRWADAVTARSFGPPAVTAECAVGFLRPGGVVIVSEPPQHEGDRWPTAGLESLGLGPPERVGAVVRIPLVRPDDRLPRSTAAIVKRPLF